MPIAAFPPVPGRRDVLAAALLAAEADEPFDLSHTPSSVLAELFSSVRRLRRLVPFATVRLLARLCTDPRAEIRCGVARALAQLAELYPERVEELILPLACDPARRVRAAAAEALAALLRTVDDPDAIVARWQWHPDRATDVLMHARRL